MPEAGDITRLLEQWGSGDRQALDQLMPMVYAEMKRIASAYLNGEREDHTLQTTALVHEAYLRLVDYHGTKLENRKHFLVVAAQAVRRVLVDHARQRGAAKRDPGLLPPDSGLTIQRDQHVDILALDHALGHLADFDADKARIVELRYFAGLSVPETAELIGKSPATVKREWAVAKAWLFRSLNGEV